MSDHGGTHAHEELAHVEHEEHEHILSPKVLLGTFAALLVLTGVTVAVARTDLGRLNIVIALAIASVKASLVAAFFMHLKYEKKINTVILVTAIFFAALLAGFTLFDTTQYQGTVTWKASAAEGHAAPSSSASSAHSGAPAVGH